jgi:hypothetical protein
MNKKFSSTIWKWKITSLFWRKWKNNIKINLTETRYECVDLIQVVQGRNEWFISVKMIQWFSQKSEYFLTSHTSISLLRNTFLRVVSDLVAKSRNIRHIRTRVPGAVTCRRQWTLLIRVTCPCLRRHRRLIHAYKLPRRRSSEIRLITAIIRMFWFVAIETHSSFWIVILRKKLDDGKWPENVPCSLNCSNSTI